MARFARLVLAAALVTASLPLPFAYAERLLEGSIGCTSLPFFSQMMRHSAAGDRTAIQGLIDNGFCLIVPDDAVISVLERQSADAWRAALRFRGSTREIWISPLSVVTAG